MPAVATAGGVPSRLGKYELLLPLAAGGMARIYIARSTGIGSFERHVVLKMITPERANDVTAVTMFLDEARLAASLNHQNVGQVFEVGEDAGIHYLAMEYVHGQDLRALLAKAGSEGTRIPLELALTVVAGAAAGLHHAHERRGPDGLPIGIVHRDVSPSNIMIGYDGAVKLLDFGIAKATARSVETQSGIIKGKFAYMAPEQCRGRDVDRRSDVFSLGIILYEISTQHRCFRADSDFDTMHRIVTGDVVRPTRLVHGYPQALEAIVMKALAIDAAQRYQSAGLLLEALESFAVSSRMSLSTMGLGRFMRDMFGEVQEPWLSPPATKSVQPIAAKESTISTTNGQGSQAHPVGEAPSASAHEDDMGFPDSSGINSAARTTFAMRGERDENEADPHMPSASYSAASALGTTRPSQQMPAQRPSQSVPAQRPSHPHVVVMPLEGRATPTSGPHLKAYPSGTTPPPDLAKVPTHQFNSPSTASGSGTSHPAIGIPGTKQGYTSGVMTRNEASYPRYQAPVEVMTGNVHLTPNRRPLLIGTGIVAAGVAVMLMVSLSGSGDDTIAPTDDPTHQVSDPASPGPATRKPDDTDVADDNMVSVVIHSDPAGADVLIAGAKVGITPFESKLKRGTKITPLTVQKDGYAPFAGKIDLGGEYENRNIKLVRVEDLPKGSDAKPPGEKDKGTTDGTDVGPTTNGDTGSRMGAEKLKPDAEKGENSEKARTEKSGSEKSGSEKSGSEKSGSEKSGSKTSSEKTGAEKSASRSSVDRTSSKASFEKSGSERSSPEKSVIERPSADKTNSERASSDKTGSEKAAPVKKEKCQPPGPNVDPFGPPICKT